MSVFQIQPDKKCVGISSTHNQTWWKPLQKQVCVRVRDKSISAVRVEVNCIVDLGVLSCTYSPYAHNLGFTEYCVTLQHATPSIFFQNWMLPVTVLHAKESWPKITLHNDHAVLQHNEKPDSRRRLSWGLWSCPNHKGQENCQPRNVQQCNRWSTTPWSRSPRHKYHVCLSCVGCASYYKIVTPEHRTR